MTPERWQEVKALFEACGRQAPAERSAFLDIACARDQSLRDEVESLLAEAEQAGGFLEWSGCGSSPILHWGCTDNSGATSA